VIILSSDYYNDCDGDSYGGDDGVGNNYGGCGDDSCDDYDYSDDFDYYQ